MSLNPLAIDPLIDLLKFTTRSSSALTELYCAPLKLLLGDSHMASKLSATIPHRLNYMRRSAPKLSFTDVESKNILNSNQNQNQNQNISIIQNENDFDTSYNGYKLLPKHLKAELIGPLAWQGVLRAVLLRLEPVKQLRKAAGEVPANAPVPAPLHKLKSGVEEKCINLSLEKDGDENDVISLGGIIGVSDSTVATSSFFSSSTSSSRNALRRLTFSTTLEEAKGSLLSLQNEARGEVDCNNDLNLVVIDEVTSTTCTGASVSTGAAVSTWANKKKGVQVNKDHLFLVTNDPRNDLSILLEAAILLETQELHTLSIKHKIVTLKAICDACYDTQRLKELLANNAEERAERVGAMNKKIREEKAKSKEVSTSKNAIAYEKCREINIAAAAAAAVVKAAKGGKGSKVAKGLAGNSSNFVPKGPKTKGWKEHDPTPMQISSMLEDMALLEKIDVDIIIDSLPEEEPLSDDEEDDNDFTLNPDGTYSMRNRASVRGKANDRKRQRVERESRLIQVTLAKDALQRAIITGGEKELRLSIRQAIKAGLRGRYDDNTTYCTELLKQAYKMQFSIETVAKEEKALSIHEKELNELCVRSTPLGSDRFHRRYWIFSHSDYDEQRLFVECDTSLSYYRSGEKADIGNIKDGIGGGGGGGVDCNDVTAVYPSQSYVRSYPDGNTYAGTLKVSKSVKKQNLDRSVDLPDFILSAAAAVTTTSGGNCAGAGENSSRINLKKDQPLCRLISSRPSVRVSKWEVYQLSELWNLCEALDNRGEREKELKAAIKAHFDISEPPIEFFKTGSEYIGHSILRTFGKKVGNFYVFFQS